MRSMESVWWNVTLLNEIDGKWSLLVSANISVQSSIAHVLLPPLLFVADTNPSQGAATTITAVCFDPSILRYRAVEKRGSSLSEVTVRSSIDPNEQCQDASKASSQSVMGTEWEGNQGGPTEVIESYVYDVVHWKEWMDGRRWMNELMSSSRWWLWVG